MKWACPACQRTNEIAEFSMMLLCGNCESRYYVTGIDQEHESEMRFDLMHIPCGARFKVLPPGEAIE